MCIAACRLTSPLMHIGVILIARYQSIRSDIWLLLSQHIGGAYEGFFVSERGRNEDTGQCVEYGEERVKNIRNQISALQDELAEAREQLDRAAEADEFLYATLMWRLPVRPERLEEIENEFSLT